MGKWWYLRVNTLGTSAEGLSIGTGFAICYSLSGRLHCALYAVGQLVCCAPDRIYY